MDSCLTEFLDTFSKVSSKPYEFLRVQDELTDNIKGLLKNLYDYTKCNEKKINENYCDKRTLPQLIVDKFDEEQIWQQLELQNGSCTDDIIQTVSELSARQDKLKFPLKLKCLKNESGGTNKRDNTKQDNVDDDNEDINADSAEDEEIEDEEIEDEEIDDEEGNTDTDDNLRRDEIESVAKKGKLKPSIVDDKFFKLSELELFLQDEERKEDKPVKEKDILDLFGNTDEEAADYKYSDFFESPEDESIVQENENEMEDNADSEEESDNDEDENEDDDESIVKKGSNTRRHEESDNDEDENEDDDESIVNKGSNKRRHEESDNDEDENEDDDESIVKKGSNKRRHEESENEEIKSEGEEHSNKESKNKKVRFSLLDSDEESSSEKDNDEPKDLFGGSKKTGKKSDEKKSSFEARQERLGHVIKKLEDEALSDKPWQMSGEVTASLRPQNSLLEEAVDFDVSVRPAPLITGEVTLRLEDVITQRIKDKAWDDVERKVKPVDTPSEFKKKLALDQEKSKLSLAEVYEKEFIKQREAATGDDTEKQEVEPPLHVEVRSMLHSLFNKLDALSNYHYTPRPVAPELKIISNVAAINMEEVAPVTVADSALLAPQEIKGKTKRSALMSKEERTDTDKKRARRLKKTRQRQRQREKARAAKEVSKLNIGLGNKYSKLKATDQVLNASSNVTKMEEGKEKVVKSSTSFFNKLQDEVKNQIKAKTSLTKKTDKRIITAKKLKL